MISPAPKGDGRDQVMHTSQYELERLYRLSTLEIGESLFRVLGVSDSERSVCI